MLPVSCSDSLLHDARAPVLIPGLGWQGERGRTSSPFQQVQAISFTYHASQHQNLKLIQYSSTCQNYWNTQRNYTKAGMGDYKVSYAAMGRTIKIPKHHRRPENPIFPLYLFMSSLFIPQILWALFNKTIVLLITWSSSFILVIIRQQPLKPKGDFYQLQCPQQWVSAARRYESVIYSITEMHNNAKVCSERSKSYRI